MIVFVPAFIINIIFICGTFCDRFTPYEWRKHPYRRRSTVGLFEKFLAPVNIDTHKVAARLLENKVRFYRWAVSAFFCE